MSSAPIRFTERLEVLTEDETQTTVDLDHTMHQISETVFKDSGQAFRSVHAKSHGVLLGTVRVHDDLPPTLAQGAFAKPGTYKLRMRLSTIPGDILDDEVSTPRGLAVKLIGVEGERLPGDDAAFTQDFVLVNAPAFSAPNAKKFLGSIKLLASTTDKAPGLKKFGSRIARGVEAAIEAFGGKSAIISTLGGHPATNILGETFYSQAPIRYGDYIAKIAIAPVSAGLIALTNAHVAINGHPNALREKVREHFATAGDDWEIRVQLCTDLEKMPIEDASVEWPENESPYIAVATITAPPQDSWSETSIAEIDGGSAFSPWHCLAAHRPLGSVMRARRMAYENSAHFRATHNACPIREPA